MKELNRRIRKKKGLLKDVRYNEVKEQVFEALDAEEHVLEQKTAAQEELK